jgi:hypothetical protein
LARLLQKAIGREGDSTDGNDFEEIDLGFQTSRSRSRQAGGFVPCFRNSDCEGSHDDGKSSRFDRKSSRFDRKSSRCCGQSACRCPPFGSSRSRGKEPSDLDPV